MGNDEIKRGESALENARYWIWLQKVMGVGTRVDCLLDTFASARAVYEADDDVLRASGVFNENRLARLKDKNLEQADSIVAYCENKGYKILTPDMPNYPERLKLVTDAPLVLYTCGDETVLSNDNLHIGVIGSRKPSQYGIDVAGTIATSLAKNGAVVVSGGALGIDSVGHNAAMDAGGKTVLIMGCGFDYPYLMDNQPMRERVKNNGVLVSEYSPKTPPINGSFVKRNRITAGLCNGVLVVEAGVKSGSLSTANIVTKYNRDLFVVTGDARGENFLGANELAQRGARIVFSADDIMTLYGYEIRNKDSFNFSLLGEDVFNGIDVFPYGPKEDRPKRKTKGTRKSKKKEEVEPVKEEKHEVDLSGLSPDALQIYDAIGEAGATIDDMVEKTHMQIRNVLIALTELEMADAIVSLAGNEYRRI